MGALSFAQCLPIELALRRMSARVKDFWEVFFAKTFQIGQSGQTCQNGPSDQNGDNGQSGHNGKNGQKGRNGQFVRNIQKRPK